MGSLTDIPQKMVDLKVHIGSCLYLMFSEQKGIGMSLIVYTSA